MPGRNCRTGGRSLRILLAPLTALALACCAPPPQPPPAPPPAVALPLPPPPPVVAPTLHAAWSFQVTAKDCLALAQAGRSRLEIAVRPEGAIRLVLSLPQDAPARPIAYFSGPAGHWLIAGAPLAHRQALFLLPRNDTSLSRILMLLSGGTFAPGPADLALPMLSLPESGADGRHWFACARSSVSGT